jgi:hypothetical protein
VDSLSGGVRASEASQHNPGTPGFPAQEPAFVVVCCFFSTHVCVATPAESPVDAFAIREMAPSIPSYAKKASIPSKKDIGISFPMPLRFPTC